MTHTTPRLIEFANGRFVWRGEPLRVQAADNISNEDWKTAAAHKQRHITKDEMGYMTEYYPNFYGVWAKVKFDSVEYELYTSFDKLNVIL